MKSGCPPATSSYRFRLAASGNSPSQTTSGSFAFLVCRGPSSRVSTRPRVTPFFFQYIARRQPNIQDLLFLARKSIVGHLDNGRRIARGLLSHTFRGGAEETDGCKHKSRFNDHLSLHDAQPNQQIPQINRVVAAPSIRAMNSRRLIRSPRRRAAKARG